MSSTLSLKMYRFFFFRKTDSTVDYIERSQEFVLGKSITMLFKVSFKNKFFFFLKLQFLMKLNSNLAV